MNELQLRQQLCQITRQLWGRGLLVAEGGLVSVELHRRRYLATPARVRRAGLEAEAMVWVDLGGENPQGDGGLASEIWRPHRVAYQLGVALETSDRVAERGETDVIRATALTTPPHLLALMRAGRSTVDFGDEQRSLAVVADGDDAALREALRHRPAVAIRGRGLLTVGATVDAVANQAEAIEHAATIELARWRLPASDEATPARG